MKEWRSNLLTRRECELIATDILISKEKGIKFEFLRTVFKQIDKLLLTRCMKTCRKLFGLDLFLLC